jgi:hypothetical protein
MVVVEVEVSCQVAPKAFPTARIFRWGFDMFKRTLISATVVALCSAATATWAAEQEQVQQKSKTQQQTQSSDQIYGSQLMTRQERLEHRNKLRAAKTAEEREQIRAEHHTRMQDRAKEKGMTLPDMPPAGGMGGGMGPGGGMGGGMGPGGGMGGGMGSGGGR